MIMVMVFMVMLRERKFFWKSQNFLKYLYRNEKYVILVKIDKKMNTFGL